MRKLVLALFVVTLARAAVVVTVSPNEPSVRAGATRQFTATVTGTTNKAVSWYVNGFANGNALFGQINTSGLYTAPAALPMPYTVTITAVTADQKVKASTLVTVMNPVPVIQSLSPSQVNTNLPFSLTVTGTGIVAGSKVMLAGTPLPTTFVSSTKLACTGMTTAAAGASLAVTVVNPDPGSQTSGARNISVMAPVKVTINPATTVSVRAGDTKQFTASLQNAVDKTVKWSVNGVPGGNAASGTIDGNGLFKGPASVPATGAVTVTVASNTDPTATASAPVTLLNPLPVITSVTPATVNYGNISVTLQGTGFAPGATVKFGGTALVVGAVTPTQITATGVATPLPGGLVPVTISNPDPGAATSAMFPVAATTANPKVTYNQAYRFLEQATFGADPASINHLQEVGFDQWLNEQFAAAPSAYTDPPDTTTGYGPTQAQFFSNALAGQDQLRQRVAFALSQIFVISGLKVTPDVALVPYLRTLSQDAFGSYLTLMRDVTLNPAMGNYLDMVNNDKFNSKTGVAPNENYARELMQLFTLGTVLLNPDGSPTTNPATPSYDQDSVATMARVFTGWTYPPIPGTTTTRHNPANYFAPMVAVETNHDSDPKTLFGQTPFNGTAAQDLDSALGIIFNHPNVAPFVALRLIQHLVKSNPSPAYISNVSAAFNATPRGSLQAVVKAVLLDPEARQADSLSPAASEGHLREPVVFMTHLLKSLGATVAIDNTLTNQGTNMGQQLFNSSSVFNYYSPFFRTAGGALAGPEFQLMNPATALVRANFVTAAVNASLGKSVVLDISTFTALAQQPDRLLDALNAALLHGQMSSDMRSSILTALTAVKDPKQRAQYAIFLVGSSAQYQVEE